jgi:hypothetical protein
MNAGIWSIMLWDMLMHQGTLKTFSEMHVNWA